MVISVYIASIIFSCLLGINDGILYGRKGADSFSWNEHILLVIIRGSLPVLVFLDVEILDLIILTGCYILHYSFFHNGFYCMTRAKMDGKILSWKMFAGFSSTDTSMVHFRFWSRSLMFLFSVVIFIYQIAWL